MPRNSSANIYLTDRDLAARYGVARPTIWRWAATQILPAPIKIGPSTTRWKLDEIEQYEAERERTAAA